MTALQSHNNRQNRPQPYLESNQQDLLLAALNSQAQASERKTIDLNHDQHHTSHIMSGSTMFTSPQETELDNVALDYTPDLDYLDGDGSFDFDNADLGGDMIGALPGGHGEQHEKRSREESAGPESGDAKRQETNDGEKVPKKPGRKPLTSEPTTKRKAQNRAAQRAFRERKEQHLKDLETKVDELTKSQEADKHENGMLKATVERLQVELREYRKRLSLNGGVSRSPPLNAYGAQSRSKSVANTNSFNFDFPKFGGLPGSQMFGNDLAQTNAPMQRNSVSVTPPAVATSRHGSYSSNGQIPSVPHISRENSQQRDSSPQTRTSTDALSQIASLNPAFTSYSTASNMHGFASTLPQMNNSTSDDTFGGLFSPSLLKTASTASSENGYFAQQQSPNSAQNSIDNSNSSLGGNSTAGVNRAFQFNSASSSGDSASPASSLSQWNANANSSCGTSPEPSQGSPQNKEKSAEVFGDKIIHANEPSKQPTAQTMPTLNSFSYGNTDFSVPSLDSFDPVLFGDYRESNDATIGGGDFSGGFFNDALDVSAPFDYGSPSNLFGILQSPQQSNASMSPEKSATSKQCMEKCNKLRDGGDDDYGLPSTQPPIKSAETGKMISCNNIWSQLQANADFQEGKFDLDSLCSELRAKAKCSESGVMVDQDHVNAAFKKLGKKDDSGNPYQAPPLMFEQESWDKVLAKMGGGKV